jgi:hypothetical protein
MIKDPPIISNNLDISSKINKSSAGSSVLFASGGADTAQKIESEVVNSPVPTAGNMGSAHQSEVATGETACPGSFVEDQFTTNERYGIPVCIKVQSALGRPFEQECPMIKDPPIISNNLDISSKIKPAPISFSPAFNISATARLTTFTQNGVPYSDLGKSSAGSSVHITSGGADTAQKIEPAVFNSPVPTAGNTGFAHQSEVATGETACPSFVNQFTANESSGIPVCIKVQSALGKPFNTECPMIKDPSINNNNLDTSWRPSRSRPPSIPARPPA